ncbi:MAG: RidA family protein [Magnetococcales bacterium]|nr:RidA family protein [Magnetococcales bacterium]
MKQSIQTPDAPEAIGPYSQAVVHNGMIFISGQIPLDPATGQSIGADISAQTQRVMESLGAILKAAGGDYGTVLKTTIYLTDLSTFEHVNQVYSRYFEAPFPARATIEVSALPKGVSIEIDAVATLAR